jgi:hypothetical protein
MFSGWRGWFGAAERSLGLLIALISVLGLIATNFSSLVFPERAKIRGSLELFDGNAVRVQFTNIGKILGYSHGFISCREDADGQTKLFLDFSTPLAVPAGSTVREDFTLFDGADRSKPLTEAAAQDLVNSGLSVQGLGMQLVLRCEAFGFDEEGPFPIGLSKDHVVLTWDDGLMMSFQPGQLD